MLTKTYTKYIQSLHHKKSRDSDNCFIAEGPKIVAEFLASSTVKIQQLLALPAWIKTHQQDCNGVELVEMDEKDLEKISQLSTPNQVLAVIKKFDTPTDIQTKGVVTLVLDTIQDPGNLGTIIRIADWFGIQQIVCSPDCADMYNPKVVQSTMGSIARVTLFYTDLASWLEDQKDVFIYAAALEGQNVSAMKAITEGLIVIGNESKGIRSAILDLVDIKITIPRKGTAESLNAAVATGIILSHIV